MKVVAKFEVKAEVPVVIIRDAETKQFIVQSPLLDVSSFGPTKTKALHNFADAATLFLAELDRMGTMDDVLAELGWRRVSENWVPPKVEGASRTIPVCVPA